MLFQPMRVKLEEADRKYVERCRELRKSFLAYLENTYPDAFTYLTTCGSDLDIDGVVFDLSPFRDDPVLTDYSNDMVEASWRLEKRLRAKFGSSLGSALSVPFKELSSYSWFIESIKEYLSDPERFGPERRT